VTDDSGTVVYARAYDPYGGIQLTWVNSFDPTPKFSGKERDSESGLDYFGARYYDNSQYRFISVDPIIEPATLESITNVESLYSFCDNNPISNFDPTGMYGYSVHCILTGNLASLAGLSPRLCEVISEADQSIDEHWYTSSTSLAGVICPVFSQKLHFPDKDQLAEILEIAEHTTDPLMLGYCLHAIQDSYSHEGCSSNFLAILFGPNHVLASLFGKDPDLTRNDWAKAGRMAERTLLILKRFKIRLMRAINSALNMVGIALSCGLHL